MTVEATDINPPGATGTHGTGDQRRAQTQAGDLSIEQIVQHFPATTGTKDVLAALEADGAAIIDGLLDADEAAHARAVVESLFDTTPMGRNRFEGFRTQRVYALLAKTRTFDDLVTHRLLRRLLSALLDTYQLSAAAAVRISPGEEAQMLHHADQLYPVPWPRPPLVLCVQLALTDLTEANGASMLALGSHQDPREAEPVPESLVPATMEAGSVLVKVGSLWHGAGANRTDQAQSSVRLHYAASWLRQQETQLLAVPPEIARDVSPELQELLGYNIRPPFLGYVDGRHPRTVLDLDYTDPDDP